jgi:hypothetical protein
MARSKRSAALFEVIHQSKAREAKANLLKTPSWWFRGKKSPPPPPAPAPSRPPAHPLTAAMSEPDLDEVASNAPPPENASASAKFAPKAPASTLPGTMDEPLEADGLALVESDFRQHRRSAPVVSLDRDRHLVRLQASYAGVILTTFGVLTLIALAFLAGRHTGRPLGPSMANASSELLRAGPASADVLEVGPGADTPAPGQPPVDAPLATPVATPIADPSGTRPPMPAPVGSADDPGPRIIGLNYVIVQSYPDEENAKQAADALNRAGIRATVERGPKGWAAQNWFSVVGKRGFDRLRNNPDYDRYEQAIRDVGAQYAGSAKFKKFDPRPFKWQGN